MKKLLGVVLLVACSISPTFAADSTKADKPVAPDKPSCGATVADCQKKVDDLTAQLKQAVAATNGARQQRDQLAQTLADSQLQVYINKQTAPVADKPK